MQIKALNELKAMAQIYGYDISNPAKNAREAVQWLYFGYLSAIKHKTEPLCRWEEYLLSSIFTSIATCKKVH